MQDLESSFSCDRIKALTSLSLRRSLEFDSNGLARDAIRWYFALRADASKGSDASFRRCLAVLACSEPNVPPKRDRRRATDGTRCSASSSGKPETLETITRLSGRRRASAAASKSSAIALT